MFPFRASHFGYPFLTHAHVCVCARHYLMLAGLFQINVKKQEGAAPIKVGSITYYMGVDFGSGWVALRLSHKVDLDPQGFGFHDTLQSIAHSIWKLW